MNKKEALNKGIKAMRDDLEMLAVRLDTFTISAQAAVKAQLELEEAIRILTEIKKGIKERNV